MKIYCRYAYCRLKKNKGPGYFRHFLVCVFYYEIIHLHLTSDRPDETMC